MVQPWPRAVSVVIPIYNSAATLPWLMDRLDGALLEIASDYEVILINDGSRDDSWDVIRSLMASYPSMVGINMLRNYGQHNALIAGIRAARFPITVTMDDDLQHPPEEMIALIAKLEEGYDVVYGVPKRLPHSHWRNLTSWATKRFMASIVGVPSARQISAFRAFRTELRQAFDDYRSPTVFLDVLLSWGATRYAVATVRHDPRRYGKSNYDLPKLVRLAMMLLTGFSTAPLRLASFTGFFFTFVGMGVLGYAVGRKVLRGSVPGFPFLASIISLFSGAQLFALGIMGEYLSIMHGRMQERPTYVIRDELRADDRVTSRIGQW